MQELRTGKEEISNKIQGHKANLSNPSMSLSSSTLPRVIYEMTNRDTQTQARLARRTARRRLMLSAEMSTTTVRRVTPEARALQRTSRAAELLK
jgi:hypothetical protein